MGRLWDKYMGTLRPDGAATVLSEPELRAALLALNGTDVPFGVRGAGGEGADLVAEWRVMEPATGSGMSRRQVERTFKIWMRLLPGEREVRAVDEQWAVTRAGSPPGRTVRREHGRGPIRHARKEWTRERGPDGRHRLVETFRLNTRDMKDPLRNTVVDAGWTWRGAHKP
ncbi:hypothetical protein J7E97_09770 [Streptomyces sp. ISL-66]|uniref:hypothetical protein n=1 Tax=Streptomyces sp. ISL-66 TaxID=2819186 RepID=UPI001BEC1544|nr:hypothetical protein [Streptomyces sp. ISL-66]MBT2468159.1 hypothetical protein [Streptomyces sp. ISL-66]